MADNVITLPTQTISGPFIGPGLPAPDTVSGAGGHQTLLNADTNPDELGQLQPLAIKQGSFDPGVQFPGILMREEQTKSLAVHLYPNLDSGRIENMGRNPAVFRVRGVFTNNIYPGPNETWTAGLLWPNTFIVVYQALLDNNDLIFQHPLFGDISVQVRSWTYELNARMPRDGAFLDMEFVETIGTNNPITTTVAGPKGSGMARSALALDTAIAGMPQSLNPPNLSLSQFFGQVTNLISQATSFPNNVVNALNTQIFNPITNGLNTVSKSITSGVPNAINTTINAPVSVLNGVQNVAAAGINAASSITDTLVNVPSYTIQGVRTAIQNTKNSILNSPIQAATSNVSSTFGVPQVNPFAPLLGVSYSASSFTVVQSILQLNNTPSQNAFQLMDKLMRALVDLMQHYIDQNNTECSQVIVAIRELLLQVQQEQSALKLNTSNQTVRVATYVTTKVMTWMQLGNYLNNPVDDLMGLNQGLITDLWVPAFTTINYYQQ